MTISPAYKQSFGLNLRPAFAWAAILAFGIFTSLLILAGAGKILNLVFPAGALAVGVLLYFRAPILYIGFSWWVCLLTPFVRRLVDYRSGVFTDPSPILLAPYLVILVSLITFWKHLPKTYKQDGLPFLLSIAAIFYGIAIGFVLQPPIKVAVAALDWLGPILFGFHLFIHWRHYLDYRQNLQRVLTWGILVMGTYGVVQYLIAPEWDRFWLISTEITAMGKPEPLGIRVWSTLNSPEPFAAIMAGSLLLLFNGQSAVRLPAAIAGYLSFLLCAVRSGWLGWATGFLSLATSLRPKLQMRLLITVLVMSICLVPLATIEPFSSSISARLETFSDLENDQSAADRQELYRIVLDSALTNVTGGGISGARIDSALLLMLMELGWIGMIPYVSGVVLLIFNLFKQPSPSSDPFIGTARAIVLTALVRFPLNVPMLGASGLLLWTFLGIGLAGLKYHQKQKQL